MKKRKIDEIEKFAKRHILLSSFLCLLTLGIIINFNWAFEQFELGNNLTDIAEQLLNITQFSIWHTFLFGSIPILLVSLLLTSFLKKEVLEHCNMVFYSRFLSSLIPTLIMTFLYYLWHAFSHYKPSRYFLEAIIISVIYSAIFASYFGRFSKATKKDIIFQSIILTFLMMIINTFMLLLQSPVF